MVKLIRLGNCIHVFDEQQRRYVKSSYRNVAEALGRQQLPPTRSLIYRSIQWVKCTSTHCPVRACQQQGHWIGVFPSKQNS